MAESGKQEAAKAKPSKPAAHVAVEEARRCQELRTHVAAELFVRLCPSTGRQPEHIAKLAIEAADVFVASINQT